MLQLFSPKRRFQMALLYVVALASGLIVLSQGMSFAMPPEDHEHAYYLRQHARLLFASGVGLFSLALMVFHLVSRLSELQALERQQGRDPQGSA